MTDDGPETSQAHAPQAVDHIYIMEPSLPPHLKSIVPARDSDWSAKTLEALAKQLSETNDFHRPLLNAAQELRDLRSVNTCLVELLRSLNPYKR